MREVTIGDLDKDGVLNYGDGYRTKRAEHGRPGFRILRVADVSDGFIRPDGDDFVAEFFRRQIGAKLSEPGDVLLTTKGTVGRVATVPTLGEQLVYSPQLCFFRVLMPEVLDRRFLHFWFKSPQFVSQASHRMNNTDMAAYINMADIRSLVLSLPEIAEQRAVAEVLGALDDKIAANDRLIETADAWVRAKYQALERASAERRPLAELASNARDQVDPGKVESDSPYVGLEHVRRRRMWLSEWGQAGDVSSGKTRFATGDTLFGKLRPYFHKVSVAPVDGICSTDILVIRALDVDAGGLVLAACASDEAISLATAGSEGTRMPRASWRDLATLEVPWGGMAPRRFSGEVAQIAMLAGSVTAESQKLAHTRDTLLPLLMSGKVTVKDAEKQVEEVV